MVERTVSVTVLLDIMRAVLVALWPAPCNEVHDLTLMLPSVEFFSRHDALWLEEGMSQ